MENSQLIMCVQSVKEHRKLGQMTIRVDSVRASKLRESAGKTGPNIGQERLRSSQRMKFLPWSNSGDDDIFIVFYCVILSAFPSSQVRASYLDELIDSIANLCPCHTYMRGARLLLILKA